MTELLPICSQNIASGNIAIITALEHNDSIYANKHDADVMMMDIDLGAAHAGAIRLASFAQAFSSE